MQKLLSPDSRFMSFLTTAGDMILLNILFLIFCVPIVTIGAAKAALYSVISRFQTDHGTRCRDFLGAFRSNFRKATLSWLVFTAFGAFLIFDICTVLHFRYVGYVPSLIVLSFAAAIWMAAFAAVLPFCTKFECSQLQLLKNALIMSVARPVRCLCAAVIDFLPVILFFLAPDIFLYVGMAWIFVYFSAAASITALLFRKPFEIYESFSPFV